MWNTYKHKKSKFYSVSVDSTLNETHIDKLTLVLRHMEEINPVERFLMFVPNYGYTSININGK